MSQIQIVRQSYINPFEAKQVAMTCELCGKIAFGPRNSMAAAMEEHRRIACTGGGMDERRVFRINYPRT